MDFAATRRGGERGELPFEFAGDRIGEALRRGEQDGGGVDIVFGLGEHVGSEVARVAIGGDDEDLGGAGDEIDADFAGEELLGGGDVDVAGADDAVGARDGAGAEGEGGDGLRAAHLEDVVATPSRVGRAEDFGDGARRGDADVGHARHLRRNHGHHAPWRAAGSGRRECTRRPYRAGARSGRGACRGRISAVHCFGIWRSA